MDHKAEEILYHNAKIFTSDPEQLHADAMIVSGGRIQWVGEEKELKDAPREKVDFEGRRVLPGLIDAHLHPLHLATIATQVPSTPPEVQSIEDLIAQVKTRAAEQETDAWIEGWGFDEGKLSERRTPTRWDLDEGAADAPVFLTRTCGHIAVANSRALHLAEIDKDTPDPEGGEIDRNNEGEPTGILRENAMGLVQKVIPVPSAEEKAEKMAAYSRELLKYGITGITDMMARYSDADDYDIYSRASEQGMKQKAALYYKWQDVEKDPAVDDRKKDREAPVHVGGFKLFSDGSVSGRTAWVEEPYLGNDDEYGISMTTSEELLAAADAARNEGIQLAVHAMGEKAIELIVSTFENTPGWLEDRPSIRIEHVSFPSEEVLQRAIKAGIGFVTQPIFLYAEIESYLTNIGPDKTKRSYPIRTMLENGGEVALSSDAPGNAWYEPVDPFTGLKAAVTRRAHDDTDVGQDERIDLQTAILLYTKEARKLTGIEKTGQLSEGYMADFFVLDEDIFSKEADRIDEVTVLETYVDGESVYRKA